jgi:hypothetical protein
VVHDGLNTESCCHVKDNTRIFGEFLNEFLVADIAFDESDLVENVGDVFFRTSGKVVEDCDAIAAGDEGIGKVRADETGTTGDESAHGRESIFYVGLLSGGSGYLQVVLRKVGDG